MNHHSLLASRRGSSWAMALLAVLTMIGGLVPYATAEAAPASQTAAADLDAGSAAKAMGLGVNIGNTLENTASGQPGGVNPPRTKEYLQTLKPLGFTAVRLPVAWDTYSHTG